MTEDRYQSDIRALGRVVDEEVESMLDAVNPSVAKRLARQTVQGAMWRLMYAAAKYNVVVLERQHRVQEKRHEAE